MTKHQKTQKIRKFLFHSSFSFMIKHYDEMYRHIIRTIRERELEYDTGYNRVNPLVCGILVLHDTKLGAIEKVDENDFETNAMSQLNLLK